MKTYRVGRTKSKSDITLSGMSPSVSGVHIELIDTENGQFYIKDLSTNGTFILKNNQWRLIEQEYVEIDTPIKLADFQTTIETILTIGTKKPAKLREKGLHVNEAYDGKIQRNPVTGEIIEE